MTNVNVENVNIIRMRTEIDASFIESIEYGIDYIGDSLLDLSIEKVIGQIIDTNKDYRNIDITETEILINYLKSIGDGKNLLESFIEIYEIENDDEDYIDFYTLIEDGYIYEIFEFLENHVAYNDLENIYNNICELNNFKFGIVGYSNWSYYIAYDDVDKEFIRDLWEGYNFYILETIVDGEVEYSVGGCYILDVETLDQYVLDHFGIQSNDYYLVDNDESTYYDKKKVKEIEHTSYSYQL